jgi:aminopeptidase YwaD
MPVVTTSLALKLLCQFPDRRLGSESNQAATRWVSKQFNDLGWRVIQQGFECMDWISSTATLTVAERAFEIHASPYSLSVDTTAELVIATTVEALEVLDCGNKILLLRGPIAQEPLMPKDYPFFFPEEHEQLISLLEAKAPAAILSATGRHPELAGGVYPFPMFEDGNFNIPSAYLKDTLGVELAKREGSLAHLFLDAKRIPSRGANVIASKTGRAEPGRIVICAHLDTKRATPGALDNAGGVCVLLSAAQKLSNYTGDLGVEMVVFNGEDYYGANGELAYLNSIQDSKDDIFLAINLDAAGYIEGSTAYSFYGCDDGIRETVDAVFGRHPELVPGESWYQSDHMVFAQNGMQAMAITSQKFSELAALITHTADDKHELVDGDKLEALAEALVALVEQFNSNGFSK